MIKLAYICRAGAAAPGKRRALGPAIAMLPILTGNVGINGGNSGARESTYTITIERLAGAGKSGEKTAISASPTDAIARGPK